METALASEIGRELANELSQALDSIRHCLEQLSDEQVWRRPTGGLNSIGNLLLHLAGNVRQWLVCGLISARDDRNRPAEFAEGNRVPASVLLLRLQSTVSQAQAILAALPATEWLRSRRIQGFEVTALKAALSSVAHFRGHTQEIIHLTRSMLGGRYRFAWVPSSPEEGAPA